MGETEGRHPQTFLFADLAGYTALTEAHGDEHAAEVVADFCESVRALLGAHDATQVKSIGDAVMLRVTDAAAGVSLGHNIVSRIGSRHAFPTVRVGVHTGPAVEREGDWFGSAVNVASRIVGVAGEREVLVSAVTREAAAETLPGVEFVPAGRRSLKNVTEPVELFKAVTADAPVADSFPTDPVCRMIVDPAHAAATETRGAREFSFCSERCHTAFVADPSLYVGEGPGGRQRWWRRLLSRS